jgi:type II secretory ATPase GspE/PulE/Tfp pilus assembly ATPase PilB-like protein
VAWFSPRGNPFSFRNHRHATKTANSLARSAASRLFGRAGGGRIGLHELLLATPAIKKLIHRRATVDEMLAVAIKEGMRTLKQDGIEKILQGHRRRSNPAAAA